MKKSIKSVLAKSMAVVMAFSLAGIAPNTSSEAAAKKPTLTKKVTVTVGKKKTVKVTSKKKVKKTTWSLDKKGKKVVSLSKKKAKSVVVKGKKAGKATLTAKIKVGKKTYKKTCKITVKKASKVTVTPVPAKTDAAKTTATPANNNNNNGGTTNATPTPKATEAPVSVIKTDAGTYTVDESATYHIPITELNETTGTCSAKKEGAGTSAYDDTAAYNNKDGSVTFTSSVNYNSAMSFYVDPVTSEDQLKADENNEDIKVYDKTKDMSEYDYIRIKVTSPNEVNARFFTDTKQFASTGWPGTQTEDYEANWIHNDDNIWEEVSQYDYGKTAKEQYVTRTAFLPISRLISTKSFNVEKMNAIAVGVQTQGVEVTIHSIDFVKVKYDKPVTGIDVKAAKTEIAPSKSTTVTATVTPADATRQIVKWSSSNEDVATVDFAGNVVAKKGAEGTATITATSTDGSKVTGSVDITVKEPSEEPTVIETHKFDLTSTDIVAKTNLDKDGMSAATKSATGIEFSNGRGMTYVDFSAYLASKNLDLTDFTALQVVWEVQDSDGKKVEDYAGAEGAPTHGKIAYVASGKLDGRSNGIDTNWTGEDDAVVDQAYFSSPYTGETCTLTIAKTNPSELAKVAGFNLQLQSLPANMHIVIKSITLVK